MALKFIELPFTRERVLPQARGIVTGAIPSVTRAAPT